MRKRTLIVISILGVLGVLIISIIGYHGYWKYQFKKHPDKLKVIEGMTIMTRSLLENEEDLIKAEEIFKEALEINPNNVDAYLNLGFTYRMREMFKEAEDAYKKAIELDPNYTKAHFELGSFYYVQKRYDEATEMFNKALELNPRHKEAQRWLNEIESDKLWKERMALREERHAILLKDPKERTPEEQKKFEEWATYLKEHKEEIEKEREEKNKEFEKRLKKSSITKEDLIQEAMKDGMTREEAEEIFLE